MSETVLPASTPKAPAPAASDKPADKPTELRAGAVGSKALVFFAMSSAAPLTGMAGFVALVFIFGGVVAPSGYLIAGAVYALFAVGLTAMSRHIRYSGA